MVDDPRSEDFDIFMTTAAMKQDFLSHYSSYSNVDLLLVLHNESKYDPVAVEAVKEILETRTVTTEDRHQATIIVEKEITDNRKKKERAQKLKLAAGNFARNIVEPDRRNGFQQLQYLCFILAAVYLYQLASQLFIDPFWHYYDPGGNIWNIIYSYLFLLVNLLWPTGIYLFYRRKKWGWVAIGFLVAFNTISATWSFLAGFFPRYRLFENADPSVYVFIVAASFYGGILYYINTLKITPMFPINRRWRYRTMLVSFLFTVFALYLLAL